MDVQTLPRSTYPDKQGDPIDFIFIDRDVVMGHVQADCCVCGWDEGSKKWPGTVMASLSPSGLNGEMCILKQNALRRKTKR